MKSVIALLLLSIFPKLSGITAEKSKMVHRRRLENKTIQAAGLVVNILGKSGKMNVANGNSIVQVTMDALRELDADGNVVGKTQNPKYSIETFANQDFTFSAEEEDTALFVFNATLNETVEETAKGIKIDFDCTLDTGSNLQVTSFLVNEEGIAGDAKGNWTVSPGDFKWNIFFHNWNWHPDAVSLELDIEIKGNNAQPVEVGTNATYDLGGDTTLELRSDYEMFGVETSFQKMADGYPLVTEKSGKTLFTFKFENHGTSFKYDPIIKFDSGTTGETTSATAIIGLKLTIGVMWTAIGIMSLLL